MLRMVSAEQVTHCLTCHVGHGLTAKCWAQHSQAQAAMTDGISTVQGRPDSGAWPNSHWPDVRLNRAGPPYL